MNKLLERCFVPIFTVMIASACTTGGDASARKGEAAQPGKLTTKVSVASVQMIQDCPDDDDEPTVEQAALKQPAAAMPPTAGAPADILVDGAEHSFEQPCDQSTVQLAVENSGTTPASIEIKAVRILSKGKVVGTLETRRPKIWTNGAYQPWDQSAAPGPSKASYKLSMPSWTEVEQAIGQSSFGHMFTLELEVAIDGQVQTVSSPEFPREEPHVIVT